MNIGIDARVIHFPGIGRYIQSLVESLAAMGTEDRFTLYVSKEEQRAALPPGFDFAWAGQSLEEINAGSQTLYIFALAVLLVYLVLAAQYESWVLPFIILLGVPLAVFGGLGAQFWRGFANDVFCQVGLVLLVWRPRTRF